MPLFYHMERLHTPHNVCMSHFPLDDYTAEQAWDIALMLPTQKQSLLSPSRSAEFLLPETLMWRGIYQAGAQMPNSLPSGSVNCAHLPQGSVLSSWERVTPRALSVSHVFSILSVCKTYPVKPVLSPPLWPRRPSMIWVCAPGRATSSQRSVSLMGWSSIFSKPSVLT